MNLTAVGNANVILTGEPSKTFFKAVYSKYTNFGLQKFRIDYDGLREIRLTEPSVFQFKVGRYADLLMDTYISVTLPDIWSPIHHPADETNMKWAPYDFRWIRNLGTNMIKEITVSCGSMVLAKYSGKYIEMMVERDFSEEKKRIFNAMSGNTVELNDPANWSGRINTYPSAFYSGNPAITSEPSIRGQTIYIPINSWFTLDSKCAFPLICLQYNDLVITVEMRPIQELFQVRDVYDPTNNYPYIQPDFNQTQFAMWRFLQSPPAVKILPENYSVKNTTWNADVHLVATYCFLDDPERRQMALEDQVYLVKDVFEYNFENVVGTKKVNLQSSSGMVSSWMWFFQRNDVNMRNEWSNYTNWPYEYIPNNVIPAPQESYDPSFNTGPGIQPLVGNQTVGNNTGFFITGNANTDNIRDIMLTSGIVLNGSYRENVQPVGVFEYLEKYTRTAGNGGAKRGVYCYNFCLNSDVKEYQPSGAINMSKFKTVELEIATMTPIVSKSCAT
jgi:Major capsid protein N-terminus/Large eukaryotic DNA virus major capsid protein